MTVSDLSLKPAGKPPQAVLPQLWAFPPNRETLGGTAYLIRTPEGNVLVDTPPWNELTQAHLREQGGVKWLFLTHRDAIANVRQIQETWACQVVIQEQEAYLLPGVAVTSFRQEIVMTERLQGLWACGYSPGSSCLYWSAHGGVLFTGRHLLPTPQGSVQPLRTAKTFHWPRQLRSIEVLRDRFSPTTLQYLCPGASIGFLRGKHSVENAYAQLQALAPSPSKA